MLPSRETNQGEPNGEIGISNSVVANLWYQLRQAYGHNHKNRCHMRQTYRVWQRFL